MKAIQIHSPGSYKVLSYDDLPDPSPGAGEALVKVEAVGVNFADGNTRRNANTAQGPVRIGGEGAGVILAVAPDVTSLAAGDRVVWTGVPGSYAEQVVAPADRLVKIPDGVTTSQAAAVFVQGLTAHYLACTTHVVDESDVCLVHAAAGGVGMLLSQIASNAGARVLGTVSSPAKAAVAREDGVSDAIIYTDVDFEDAVKTLTAGEGVSVVYDSVGKDTFLKGFNVMKPRGIMVSYGQSSGPIEPLDTSVLRGSLYFTRVGLAPHIATREALEQRANDILNWVANGSLKVHIHEEIPLREAGRAQRAIESRETIGKVLLVP